MHVRALHNRRPVRKNFTFWMLHRQEASAVHLSASPTWIGLKLPGCWILHFSDPLHQTPLYLQCSVVQLHYFVWDFPHFVFFSLIFLTLSFSFRFSSLCLFLFDFPHSHLLYFALWCALLALSNDFGKFGDWVKVQQNALYCANCSAVNAVQFTSV